MTGQVLKHDVEHATTQTRDLGAAVNVGEFLFVPRDEHSGEDDGWLMGTAYHRDGDRSELRPLDAGTLEDVAIVELPARVPAGFHGNWITTGPAGLEEPARLV
ncbi:MAG: carotenoid oxygenase family protein [Actinobacteria bacterium]|nr:carotenoid oxygenase family protein [Actinomycetota bacterium]